MRGNLFSESWFKVAGLQVGLLGSVSIQKQYYRGVLWYVLRDSFNNIYFRITPEARRFIAMLTPDKTVEEIWDQLLESHAESTPSQEEVVELLSHLHMNNMLYFRNVPKNDAIFERQRENRRKELKDKLVSIMWIRVPLWDPDRWLSRMMPFIRSVISLKGLCLWLIVVFAGMKTAAENLPLIFDRTQGILAPSNLVLLYLTVSFLKLFHELGHAMMNKRFGGPVHSLGVMFLVFTPLPYMDATSSWFFQDRLHRMLVSAMGMMVDLFFAALAALVWAHTGDGLVHGLAFNVMIVGSVATLVFNGNPLLKFDSYYLLTDFLEIPNLYQRSLRQWLYWAEKYLFDAEHTSSSATSLKEAVWLALYGLGSLVYRVLILAGIALIVADKSVAAGLLMVILFGITMIFFPIKQFVSFLAQSPKLQARRKRAVAVSLVTTAAVFFLCGICPFYSAARVPGIIESGGFSNVYAPTEGKLAEVRFKSGQYVKKGDVIATLTNHELELDKQITLQQLARIRAMKQKAMSDSAADLKSIYARESVLTDQLQYLCEEQGKLTVAAENAGYFISSEIESLKGTWLHRQTQIGTLIGDGAFTFHGIVSQEQAFRLFEKKRIRAELRLQGDAAKVMRLTDIVMIPFQKDQLPSAALGWPGGGDISVKAGDVKGEKAEEPFFECIGKIVPASGTTPPVLLHGRSGVARLALPPEPVAFQFYRAVKQLIQKRYKI